MYANEVYYRWLCGNGDRWLTNSDRDNAVRARVLVAPLKYRWRAEAVQWMYGDNIRIIAAFIVLCVRRR